jgi:hypothetical protein
LVQVREDDRVWLLLHFSLRAIAFHVGHKMGVCLGTNFCFGALEGGMVGEEVQSRECPHRKTSDGEPLRTLDKMFEFVLRLSHRISGIMLVMCSTVIMLTVAFRVFWTSCGWKTNSPIAVLLISVAMTRSYPLACTPASTCKF